MMHFAEMTPLGQARRVRRLAQEALSEYRIAAESVELLSHYNNTTFLVRTSGLSEGTEGRFVLRVSRPGFQGREEIVSEILWLEALRRGANLHVPEAIPTPEEEYVVRAEAPGVPEPRDCVLFRWIRGRFLDRSLGPGHMRLAGETLARVHLHGQRWKRPTAFSRKAWGIELLKGDEDGVDDRAFWSHIGRQECRTVEATFRTILRYMSSIGRGSEAYGLIHADYHHGNFLFLGETVRVIDFDECGWGYYAYDIAVALSGVRHRRSYAEYRSAFLDGYRSVRSVSSEEEMAIGPFLAGRLLTLAIWRAGLRDHQQLQRGAAEFARGVVSEIPSLLHESRAAGV